MLKTEKQCFVGGTVTRDVNSATDAEITTYVQMRT
jgi:hypothetical protein